MREVRGDLWTLPADWRCITTNGSVKRDGTCVMGRGCAREAKDRYPALAGLLGGHIQTTGNVVGCFASFGILSFPVKHRWMEPADLDLIHKSAKALGEFARDHADEVILLPRPGCGNGNRTWEEVAPLLADLPDNVQVVTW